MKNQSSLFFFSLNTDSLTVEESIVWDRSRVCQRLEVLFERLWKVGEKDQDFKILLELGIIER